MQLHLSDRHYSFPSFPIAPDGGEGKDFLLLLYRIINFFTPDLLVAGSDLLVAVLGEGGLKPLPTHSSSPTEMGTCAWSR